MSTWELYCAKCDHYMLTTQREGTCPNCDVQYEIKTGVYLTEEERKKRQDRSERSTDLRRDSQGGSS
jgi:hypothetical protein